jgi:hypothetical protein
MDGGDRAGFMQVAETVDSLLISSTLGACSATGEWVSIRVVSSAAIFIGITAPGLKYSSLVSSGTTYLQNQYIRCSKITMVELSSDLPEGIVEVQKKVLL